jgi:hypothetical protein
MRKRILTLFALAVLSALSCLASSSEAAFELGIAGDDGGIRSFFFAVGDYYRVPEPTVVAISNRRIPDDEVPVALFIAGRAHVDPSVVVDLRLSGLGWWDISVRYGIFADAYYVPVKAVKLGPPYGHAYGYYRNKPKSKWKAIKLSNADVVNLVNLRFMSDYHGIAPETVMQKRGGGAGFKSIHGDIEKSKGKGKTKGAGNGNHGKGKGKKK